MQYYILVQKEENEKEERNVYVFIDSKKTA